MAKLYFRYGLGKSAQLCQVAYNYINERDMNVIIINAKDNELIQSRIEVDGKRVLEREPNFKLLDCRYCFIRTTSTFPPKEFRKGSWSSWCTNGSNATSGLWAIKWRRYFKYCSRSFR